MSPQKIKKLEKLAKVLDGGDVELLTLLDKLEDKTAKEIQALQSVVTDALAIAEQTKKLEGKRGKDGYTPIKGKDYFDGVDGKDYQLTKEDKKQIAKSITVPVVEKVIEKTETIIKEHPIVTNEIVEKTVEVAVLDEATVAYLEDEIKKLEEQLKRVGRGRGSMLGLDAVNRAIEKKVYVSDTAPVNPELNDIWIDTNAYTYRAVTSTYTITSEDYMLDCSGTFTISLPTAVGFTGEYIIKNSGIGIITIDGNGSETIDGNTTVDIVTPQSLTLRSNGTNFIIV